MANLSPGAVSHRSVVLGRGSVGVKADLDIEDGGDQRVGGAEGAQDQVGLERGVGKEQLDREILVRLEVMLATAQRRRGGNRIQSRRNPFQKP